MELIEPVVPPCVATLDIVITPFTPTVSIEVMVVFAGIPVPLIDAPTTRFAVLISLIDVDPVVTFPFISN